jgi:hypothetical protein
MEKMLADLAALQAAIAELSGNLETYKNKVTGLGGRRCRSGLTVVHKAMKPFRASSLAYHESIKEK